MRTLCAALSFALGLWVGQSAVTVRGVITDADSKVAVPHARILFARTDGPISASVVIEADDQGRFLGQVPAGSYRVFADGTNYLRREHTQPVSLQAASQPPPIALALTRTGVITGRVTAASGTPVTNAYVRAWTSAGMVAETRSNDLGEYRLFGLAPGSYVVSAERYLAPRIEGTMYVTPTPPCPDCMGEGRGMVGLAGLVKTGGYIDPRAISSRAQVPTYFPAAKEPTAATPVNVRPGAVVTGIDIQLIVLIV